MTKVHDVKCLLHSLQIISEASVELQRKSCSNIWKNSSLRMAIQEFKPSDLKCRDCNITPPIKESIERISAVAQGAKSWTNSITNTSRDFQNHTKSGIQPETNILKRNNFSSSTSLDAQQKLKPEENYPYKIELSESDKKLLKKLDMEYRAKLIKQNESKSGQTSLNLEDENNTVGKSMEQTSKELQAAKEPKVKLKLSENSKQRKVPSSRIGRMISFGSLAAGLGIGTATEYAKRTLGIADLKDETNPFLSKANLDRIVDTLCKVRGAALKLGQIMSIQDESVVNPELAKALERVRKSADFMPDWQVEQMMCSELGSNWRDKFLEFERKPFAAASIGQVHIGKLHNGQFVAVKIQYPGVSKGIESDIDNLGGIMKMWNIFPKGMFLENLMAVAKRELAWEVDYAREAECTKKFKNILRNYKEFYVPAVVDDLSTKQVFTTELLDGLPVDQCFDMDYSHRQFIGEKIMELCLLEILKFRYMQTDPNWANFLYNPDKRQLMLLDFGASREYSDEFMDRYIEILKAACDGNREKVLTVSKELGFLTGYESKIMEEAHVDAVMILGEVFTKDEKYDFAHQDMTIRIQNLAQVMLTHRLCPPPEEVYSLHRKLSGVFLLLSKLQVSINCRETFLNLYNDYIINKK